MATLRASEQGKQRIQRARNNKGWIVEDPRWLVEASKILEPHQHWEAESSFFADGVSAGTWKAFLYSTRGITTEVFKAFCQVLELSWEEVKESTGTSVIRQGNHDWQKICREMLESQKQSIRRQATEILAEPFYVQLGLVERKHQPRRGGDFSFSPEQGSGFFQLDKEEIIETYEHNEFLEQVIKQKQSKKSQGKRIAIIGEPGAGKTTLLEAIAFSPKTPGFPIWISLGSLGNKSLEEYLCQKWLKDALKTSDVTQQQKDLEELFKSGEVLLLLDGVDEMPASSPVEALAKIRDELTGWVADARVILTCRVNVWDASVNTLQGFDTYRTLEFSYGDGNKPDQVKEFICQWFSHTDKPDLGELLRKKLDEERHQRIRDLVKNPMRLSLLCQSWYFRQGDLPETKAALYEQFTRAFYEWKEEQFSTSPTKQKELNAALGLLAREAIDKEKSRFGIRESFAIDVIGEDLFNLACKLHWLNFVYKDADTHEKVYVFFHPTFQEYFAACAIDDWHFFLNDVSIDPRGGTFRIFYPQWKTVILLWLGRENVEGQQKEEFINALVLFNDMREGFYRYPAQFLAAVGIAEFRDYSWADELLSLIVKWSCGEFSIDKQEWRPFLEPVQEGARAALLETDSTKAVTALVEFIQNAQNKYECTCRPAAFSLIQAALSLGQIDKGNPVAIAVLLELIEKYQDEEILLQAALNLEQIDEGNPIVVNVLIELIQNYEEEAIQDLAIGSLETIGLGNQKAIAVLIELIEKSQDEITRLHTAESLGKIDQGNPIAIATLVELIKNPQSHYVCELAAESLVKIGISNRRAVAALIELIDKSKYEITRLQAAWSLGQIDEGNPIAIATLIELIDKSKYKNICDLAAKSLEDIGAGNRKAIAALVELIENSQDESTRWLAAASLGQIEEGNPIAVNTLVELIKNSQDETIRLSVIKSLGEIGKGNSNAIAALVESIGKYQDEISRLQVAESLGKIEEGNLVAVAILLALIKTPQDISTRWRTAKTLGKIDKGNPIAIATLSQLIKNDQNTSRYCIEVWSLGKIDKGIATTALVKFLQIDQSVELFYAITNSLGDILGEAQMAGVVTALKDCLSRKTYNNDFRRFEACHKVIWYCAQNMSYPDFYYAWHGEPSPVPTHQPKVN